MLYLMLQDCYSLSDFFSTSPKSLKLLMIGHVFHSLIILVPLFWTLKLIPFLTRTRCLKPDLRFLTLLQLSCPQCQAEQKDCLNSQEQSSSLMHTRMSVTFLSHWHCWFYCKPYIFFCKTAVWQVPPFFWIWKYLEVQQSTSVKQGVFLQEWLILIKLPIWGNKDM